MHGDVAYCKKHGHDWELIDNGFIDGMPWIQVECKICGKEYMTFRLCEGGKQ